VNLCFPIQYFTKSPLLVALPRFVTHFRLKLSNTSEQLVIEQFQIAIQKKSPKFSGFALHAGEIGALLT
jgi:hypothetical protein